MTEGISENPGVPGTSGKIGMTEFREINALYLTLNKMLRKKKGGSVYILPADPPLYFGGEVPVTGKFDVGKGKTAAIGLILGVITSVNQGYVQFLWGNFGTHRPEPNPLDLNYEDYGRIEYRFCPLLVAELERQANAYFD